MKTCKVVPWYEYHSVNDLIAGIMNPLFFWSKSLRLEYHMPLIWHIRKWTALPLFPLVHDVPEASAEASSLHQHDNKKLTHRDCGVCLLIYTCIKTNIY
jgi:hypothetical protein